MIDLRDRDDEEQPSPAYVLGRLSGYAAVRTMLDVDETKQPVYLVHGDEGCSKCGRLIDPAAFGDAPFFVLLARQKQTHGFTRCEGCLSMATSSDSESGTKKTA